MSTVEENVPDLAGSSFELHTPGAPARPTTPPPTASGGAPPAVEAPGVPEGAPPSGGRKVLSSGLVQLLPQMSALAVNLALTPFVIHGFGVQRYGLFLFAMTVSTLLGQFDGGLNGSATRYFSIFAGQGDKVAPTRLVCTLVAVVSGGAVAVSAIAWFLAPPIMDHLHMDAGLRPEGVFLLRAMGLLMGLILIRNIPMSLLYAHQRYALPSILMTVLYVEYVAGMVLSVERHWGLRGVAATMIVQQLVVTFVLVPATFRHMTLKGVRLYSRVELKEFLGYSGKVQVVGLANLFLQELDVIVIGAVMPIHQVAVYNAGANFAMQLRTVPMNAITPMMATLGQTLGRAGRGAMTAQLGVLQRAWVQAMTGWCTVGAAAIAFGVTAWLGDYFRDGGIVGAVVLVGNLFYLGPAVLNNALGLLGEPGIEARFAVRMVVVNVALTIPLVLTHNVIGVAAATAVAQVAAAVYLVRRVRRKVSPDLAGFMRQIPVVPSLVASAVTVAIELAIHPVVPHGAAGLLCSAVPGAIGLALYAVLVLGPARARSLAQQGFSRVRARVA